MRYFQFNMRDDDVLWKKYIGFGIDFEIENGERVWAEDLFKRHLSGSPAARLRITDIGKRKRFFPEIDFTDTRALIVRKDCFDALAASFRGLTPIPVGAGEFATLYYVLWFDEVVDCVDWAHSEYEPWPEGAILQAWHNPRANWFIRPALNRARIPDDLEVFRLKEWGGPFNFVASEKARDKFLRIENAPLLTNFVELKVISEHEKD